MTYKNNIGLYSKCLRANDSSKKANAVTSAQLHQDNYMMFRKGIL